MDNLCHTLTGLALAEAGLKRRTRLASAALVIGANLPDVDVLAYLRDPVTALGFRRGWTHGLLALAVWPFVLAGLLLAWDRLVRRRLRPEAEPAIPRALLLVSAVAVASHPLLDLLNVYGVRLLAPFSDRWFYGDTLFIVDPWVWAALFAGIVLSRLAQRSGARHPRRPARIALAACTIYVAVMAWAGMMSRNVVRRHAAAMGYAPQAVMVAPEPVNPFARSTVMALDAGYVLGRLDWFATRSTDGARTWSAGASYHGETDAIARQWDLPVVRAAMATDAGRTYLRWARFPYAVQGPYDGCPALHVCLRDARYFGQSWAEVAIGVTVAVSLPRPVSPELP